MHENSPLAGGCAPRTRVKSQPQTENGPNQRAKTTCVDGNELKKSGARAFFEPAIMPDYSGLQQRTHAGHTRTGYFTRVGRRRVMLGAAYVAG
ncbi:MAG: hypothetical protein CBARDMAM_3763 [uncultured Caballeronia sp.]|nr:MAG: hypothetical protein CBARDMAM_3763 [uncultured Caballeronia sp.]